MQLLGDPTRPKLVFLHGLMGSAANWRKITSMFEDTYHILIFDQRGHGRSFKPDEGYAPEDYAWDLKKILDELGWQKIFLVGHSMGGRNALEFAWRWPQSVEKLVIEDIGPDANPEAVARTERLLELVPTPFASREGAKEFLLQRFPDLIASNPQASVLAQYFYSNIEEKNGLADWRFSKKGVLASLHEGRERERWQEFRELTMPILVVRGEKSEDLSREVMGRMVKENHHAQAIEIPRAGHWVHFDQPEIFAQALRQFFQTAP